MQHPVEVQADSCMLAPLANEFSLLPVDPGPGFNLPLPQRAKNLPFKLVTSTTTAVTR